MTRRRTDLDLGPLALAAFAAIGAGSVNVAAAVIHHDHWQAVVALAAVAAAQLGWGGWAIERAGPRTAAVGAVVSAAACAGWMLAKTSGIGFVPGLTVVEGIQTADALAFVLSVVALGLLGRRLLARAAGPAGPRSREARSGPSKVVWKTWAAIVLAATLASLATIRGHDHGAHAAAERAAGLGAFDPSRPVDLAGVAGVDARQQAAAERLVRAVVADTPRYPTRAAAAAAGFRSIGAGAGGFELWIDGARLVAGHPLDPARPEGLVFAPASGGSALLAVAFVVATPDGPDLAPDIGGSLTLWTPLTDLCASGPASRPVFGPAADASGRCRPGLALYPAAAVLPVWVTPQPCGPFASLAAAAGATDPAGDVAACGASHVHSN